MGLTRRSAGLRVRLLFTLLGAAMLIGGALLVALLDSVSESMTRAERAAY